MIQYSKQVHCSWWIGYLNLSGTDRKKKGRGTPEAEPMYKKCYFVYSSKKKKKIKSLLDAALFKLDYSEQFYPNQSFARFWNPGVKTQRLIPKD
jgi:hypothetical protein